MNFTLSALRAIVEMLGLCLIGQGVLGVLAGKGCEKNAIYRLLALITRAPRAAVGYLLPASTSPSRISVLTGLLLFVSWVALAWLRKIL